jgi:hypothetical protein
MPNNQPAHVCRACGTRFASEKVPPPSSPALTPALPPSLIAPLSSRLLSLLAYECVYVRVFNGQAWAAHGAKRQFAPEHRELAQRRYMLTLNAHRLLSFAPPCRTRPALSYPDTLSRPYADPAHSLFPRPP